MSLSEEERKRIEEEERVRAEATRRAEEEARRKLGAEETDKREQSKKGASNKIGKGYLGCLGVIVLLIVVGSLLPKSPSISPESPSTSPVHAIAAAAISDAGHSCGTVVDAVRGSDGGIRAVCSNGEAYRVFTLQGKLVAMKCSAAAKLGVSGC